MIFKLKDGEVEKNAMAVSITLICRVWLQDSFITEREQMVKQAFCCALTFLGRSLFSFSSLVVLGKDAME